ncbi:putative arabinose transporter [Corynebacterium ciconiae DSM 44920]|nr:putative arabinose transporter [Corynebacterium ciconiae DSM 44920]
MATLVASNLVTTLSPWLILTLVARCVAGAAAALVWGVLTGYARGLAAPQLQGRALAITGLGQPLALAGGVPAGAYAATIMDWRWVFGLIASGAACVALWIGAAVPDRAGGSCRRRTRLAILTRRRSVRIILGVTGIWIVAHNLLYTYTAAPARNHRPAP